MLKKIIYTVLILGMLSLSALPWKPQAQAAPPAQLTVFPTPTPGPDGKIIYIVQPGDTLWRISAITGIPVEEIRALNKLGAEDPIKEGDKLLIGLAGPVEPTAQAIATFTPSGPIVPTGTPERGWGVLCIVLYNDRNGDSLRQEEEPAIPGGQISVNNRQGSYSQTADTASAGETECNEDPFIGYDPLRSFVMFTELPEAEYTISIAIPEGYNPTTEMNRTLKITAGDATYLSFGAQPNSETIAETALIPETPRRSPIFGIIGGLLLLGGLVLGIYASFLRRTSSIKNKRE